MHKRGYQHICILLLMGLMLFSCKPDSECRQTVNIFCKVIFNCDSLQGDTLVVPFNNIDSLSVQGVGIDSILYDNSLNVSNLMLPLRNDTTLTQYLLDIHGITDTLSIVHQNKDNFISLACGCFIYHTIDTAYISTKLCDSVEVINSSVENVVQDNLCLHIHF